MEKGNLFNPVEKTPEEFLEILAESSSGSSRIEHIVSHGHVSPENFWYDQDEYEFVAVLQGEAEIKFENEIIKMFHGDWIIISPHEKHRVVHTSTEPPCVWLAVFYKK